MAKLALTDPKNNKKEFHAKFVGEETKNLSLFLDIGEKLNVPKILDRDVA